MEIGFTGTVLFSCKSQGFGDPVRRNRTPSLNESGRSFRNARRDIQRARRSLATDIKGGMTAKRDIIYEYNEELVRLAQRRTNNIPGHKKIGSSQ